MAPSYRLLVCGAIFLYSKRVIYMELKEITSRDVDFAKGYTNVVMKADLVDYSTVKGSMIIRPLGYAIWEQMQRILDKRLFISSTGGQI